jgi:hypothetical protein
VRRLSFLRLPACSSSSAPRRLRKLAKSCGGASAGRTRAGESTHPCACDAGLEAAQQRRHAHVRVQHIVDPLLRVRVLRRAPRLGRDGSGPSSEGAGAALKSGLKLSALSMGDMAGGAAIAGAVVVVAVVICAPSAVEVRARVLGCSFRAGCRARDAPTAVASSSQPHL